MRKEFKFYGVCGNQYKLDDTIWEAVEDESDGYRSYLKTIKQVESNEIFECDPIATVYVREMKEDEMEGYELVDIEDEHIWLQVGTNHTDSYYPYFVFYYNPVKQPKTTWEEFIKEVE